MSLRTRGRKAEHKESHSPPPQLIRAASRGKCRNPVMPIGLTGDCGHVETWEFLENEARIANGRTVYASMTDIRTHQRGPGKQFSSGPTILHSTCYGAADEMSGLTFTSKQTPRMMK